MERVWGRAWVYVGHASQIQKPGDYFATTVGKQPVIMLRHKDDSVHVWAELWCDAGASRDPR